MTQPECMTTPCPLISSGGQSPKVRSIAQPTTLISLGRGDTVYALAISQDQSRVVCGGKSGNLALLERSEAGAWRVNHTMTHCAPVLAVCLTRSNKVLFSDTQGGCFLWSSNGTLRCLPKGTSRSPVATLVCAGDAVVGHGVTGHIQVWPAPFDELSHELTAPAPAKPFSWSSGLYCPSTRTVHFPSECGRLITLLLDDLTLRTMPAHEGAFYLLLDHPEGILSIGYQDGKAIIWPAPYTQEAAQLNAPANVVAGAWSGIETTPLILLSEYGVMGYADFDGNAIALRTPTDDEDIRCLLGVDLATHAKMVREQREQRLQQALSDFETSLNASAWAACESIAASFSKDGRDDVALRCLAEVADRRGDIPNGIRYRKELAYLLPDTPSSIPSLVRYADQLLAHFLLKPAASVYRRLLAIEASDEFATALAAIESIIFPVADCVTVIKELPPETLHACLAAASALGTRWDLGVEIRRWPALDCHGVSITGEMILAACKGSAEAKPVVEPDTIRFAQLRLLGGVASQTTNEAIFISRSYESCLRLCFVLVILNVDGESIAHPRLLLLPDTISDSASPSDWNARFIHFANTVPKHETHAHWVAKVAGFAEDALGNLVAATLRNSRRGRTR